MKRWTYLALATGIGLGTTGGAVLAMSDSAPQPDAAHDARDNAEAAPLRFADADLFIEINGTDGDAGLQTAIDADAWRRVIVLDPAGRSLLDFRGEGRMAGWGLTGLTFESSEPAFDEVPFARFKARFPEGRYRFRGRSVDGDLILGSARLTHTVPRRPTVVSPQPDAAVPAAGFVVEWKPVARPTGVEIVDYQVIIAGDRGEEYQVLFGPDVTRASVPPGVLVPGREYAVEVLARERSGNRTITEVPFSAI